MAKKKKEVELPERSALESLANEMNEVMGLDPKIKFNRKTTDEELIEAIKENAVDEDGAACIYHSDFEEDADDPDKDVFTEEARETLEALEIEIGDEPEGDEFDEMDMDALKEYIEENELDIKVTKKMDEDAVREAIREAQSEAEAEPEPEEEKPAKKGSKKQKEEEEEPEEEEEKPKKGAKKQKEEEKPAKKGNKKAEEVEEEEEKPAKKGAKKDEKPAKKADKPAKKEKKESKKYGRIDSIVEAIQAAKKAKKGVTFKQLCDSSAKLYCDKNDIEYKEEYSNTWLQASLTIQVALGAADLKDGKYTFN